MVYGSNVFGEGALGAESMNDSSDRFALSIPTQSIQNSGSTESFSVPDNTGIFASSGQTNVSSFSGSTNASSNLNGTRAVTL